MTSLLLGTLVNSDINNIYNSNIQNNINNIEKNQANQDFSKAEYIKQFDELRFDNISEPTAINNMYSTITGVNSSLQRNLDFKNGYSNFQETDMHYDVVSKNKFTHNNMVPNTARRDFSTDSNRAQRKIENFTGISSTWRPKKESEPFFEPFIDLTWPTGMPAVSNILQNRYLPSNKNNNGNLPFENNVKVRPGVDNINQGGNYAVYRIKPRTVDELRTDVNKKISYANKPLETVKIGEVRGPDFNLTKYKLPDYRETNFDNLIASKAYVDKPKQTGKFYVDSQRGEQQIYKPGPAINGNKGGGPDKNKIKFEPSKKENFTNDNTRSVNEINNRPVMTNAKSYTVCENQRFSTNVDYQAPVGSSDMGSYVIDYKDIPLTTLRQLTVDNPNNQVLSSQEKSNYVFSNDFILPLNHRQTSNNNDLLGVSTQVNQNQIYNGDFARFTGRQSTSHNQITNNNPAVKSIYSNLTDVTKDTLRQTTSHNTVLNSAYIEKTGQVYNTDNAKTTHREGTSHNLAINVNSNEKTMYSNLTDSLKPTIKQTNLFSVPEKNVKTNIEQTYSNLTDSAKITIREQTENNNHTGTLNNSSLDAPYLKNNDSAKPTVKQTTLLSTPGGRLNNSNMGNYATIDEAKTTIKQTTLLENYNGGIHGEIEEKISHEASNNMQIDCRREISTYNRGANGKADLNGPYIDRDNVKLNEPLLYSHVSHPFKNLDNSVMPSSSAYPSNKPIIQMSGYYINSNLKDTLKNNSIAINNPYFIH